MPSGHYEAGKESFVKPVYVSELIGGKDSVNRETVRIIVWKLSNLERDFDQSGDCIEMQLFAVFIAL